MTKIIAPCWRFNMRAENTRLVKISEDTSQVLTQLRDLISRLNFLSTNYIYIINIIELYRCLPSYHPTTSPYSLIWSLHLRNLNLRISIWESPSGFINNWLLSENVTVGSCWLAGLLVVVSGLMSTCCQGMKTPPEDVQIGWECAGCWPHYHRKRPPTPPTSPP